MPDNEIKSEPQWHEKFPNEPGWYWCFQALPKEYGTNIFPVWVDDVMALPRNIAAYYGPVTPPLPPINLVPERYRESMAHLYNADGAASNDISGGA